MKVLSLVLLVAACGKPATSDKECEAQKATYLAWTDGRVKLTLAEDTPAQRAKDEPDAAKERALADANFIGACHRMKLDSTCWVADLDKAKKTRAAR